MRAAARIGAWTFVALTPLCLAEFALVTLDLAPAPPPVIRKSREEDRAMKEGRGLLMEDEHRLWALRPGAEIEKDRVNARGYRGEVASEEKRARRVVALGDGVTLGVGLAREDAWPFQLERMLREHGFDCEVINLGVEGYTVAQGLSHYELAGRPLQPDVVVAAFGAVQEVMTPPGGLSDEDRMRAIRSASRWTHVFDRYALWRLVRGDTPPLPVSHRVPPERFRDLIGKLADAVAADGATLVLVSPPRRPGADRRLAMTPLYTRILGEEAERSDAPLADAMAALRGRIGERPEEALFKSDIEPTVEGHRLIAMTVALAMYRAGLL